MPRYELSEGTSNKFWQFELQEAAFTTTYGRIGSNGQSATKTFDTPAKAKLDAWLHQRFLGKPKAWLEQGVAVREPHTTDLTRQRQGAVIDVYGAGSVPSSLDVATESAALVLLPRAMNEPHWQKGLNDLQEHSSEVEEALLRFWVAHSGLPFALEAYVATFLPLTFEWGRLQLAPWHRFWLSERPERVDKLFELQRRRTDRLFRSFLVALTPDEQARARATAENLRKDAGLLVRSVLSAIFLDPAWIDADLEMRVQTKEPGLFTAESLCNAGSATHLGAFLGMTDTEQLRLMATAYSVKLSPSSISYRPAFASALVERFGEGGVSALAQWVHKTLSAGPYLGAGEDGPLAAIGFLLDSLTGVSNTKSHLQLAAEVLTVLEAIGRFESRVVETKKLLGLMSRGWRRSTPGDGGIIDSAYKPIGDDFNAGVHFETGIIVGYMQGTEPTQKMGSLDFGSGEPQRFSQSRNPVALNTISDVVISEVLRDLESLGEIAAPAAELTRL